MGNDSQGHSTACNAHSGRNGSARSLDLTWPQVVTSQLSIMNDHRTWDIVLLRTSIDSVTTEKNVRTQELHLGKTCLGSCLEAQRCRILTYQKEHLNNRRQTSNSGASYRIIAKPGNLGLRPNCRHFAWPIVLNSWKIPPKSLISVCSYKAR